jgi:hypothetical protein
MVLVLFHAEDLREFIVGCVRATTRIRKSRASDHRNENERVVKGKESPLDNALNFFVLDGALKPVERDEIVKLINYRNHIAHRIEYLMADIGRSSIAAEYTRFRQKSDPQYDYDAVRRLQFYKRLFEERVRPRYTMELSLSRFYFEAAEKTFGQELKRLRRKIDRQLAKRKLENSIIEGELSLKGTDLVGDLDPFHPANQHESGKLTKRGVEICYRLYDLGKSPLVVAYLMHISLKAAINRKKLWQAAGGLKRSKMVV